MHALTFNQTAHWQRCPLALSRLVTVGLVCLALIAMSAFSQDAPPPDVMKLSIKQLMNVDVDTVYGASKFEQRTSQAPAYVTIITADEIRKYGYRTLAEVLRSVPGLFVDYDRNYSYLGIRGFSNPGDYSAEVLLLIDGHRVNDNVYDSPMFGTEFMLDVGLIKRVEVIRGPALGEAFAGATVNGNKVVIEHFRWDQDMRKCQAIFIPPPEHKHLHAILVKLKDSSVLTISDIPQFSSEGGMIGLVFDVDRIRFEINLDAANAARLQISSKLLTLARSVKGHPLVHNAD